jgi:AmmeMemoRadiSam system protein B
MHRQAAVAGSFYPSDAESVTDFIKKYELHEPKIKALAALVPHAGYVYSGATAVRTISMLEIPDTVIISGPNHTGAGADASVFPKGTWETPYGDVETDPSVIEELTSDSIFTKDSKAHAGEHSLEVILPILKYFKPDVKVVFITLKYFSIDRIRMLADKIASVSETKGFLYLISSDFNHFEDEKTTELKDNAAIKELLEMDAEGLYNVVHDLDISMCGVIPACVGLEYLKTKNVKNPVLVEHTHSGHVNGDNTRVVGYAGIIYK